jgi:heme/copper-type cytochrome/quinol oxidase subunit 1
VGPKEWVRIIGVLVTAAGLLCLPVGIGVSPKRDLSFFSNLADLNILLEIGAICMTIGVLFLVVSLFLPCGEDL